LFTFSLEDIELALTLLVIGCPGALVISTPVSVISGIGRAAKAGILIKGGEYLENAGKITALALDKTGTLTYGKPRLTNVIPLSPLPQVSIPVASSKVYAMFEAPYKEASFVDNTRYSLQPFFPLETAFDGWTMEQSQVIYWAAIAESHSEHPLAAAILTAAQGQLNIPSPDEFETFTGKGIFARYDGYTIHVGTPALLQDLGIAIRNEMVQSLDSLKLMANSSPGGT
jgi:Cd2+/Zn2+-exporting ATPase